MTQNFNNTVQATHADFICFSNGKVCKDPALMGTFTPKIEKSDPYNLEDQPKLLVTNPRTDLTFCATVFKVKPFSPFAFDLLSIFQDAYFKTRKESFSLLADDCIKLCGITDQKHIRDYRYSINRMISSLGSVGVEDFSEIRTRHSKYKTVQSHSYIPFFKKLEYISELNQINVMFNDVFIEYIRTHGKIVAPLQILQIDNKDLTSLQIAIKLCSYNGCNQNLIKVSNVLEDVPSLSKREELKRNKPKADLQIPFLNSLQKLSKLGIIQNYSFVRNGAERQVLTAEQVRAGTYKQFENLFLEFTLTTTLTTEQDTSSV